jgi:hypothetical protein
MGVWVHILKMGESETLMERTGDPLPPRRRYRTLSWIQIVSMVVGSVVGTVSLMQHFLTLQIAAVQKSQNEEIAKTYVTRSEYEKRHDDLIRQIQQAIDEQRAANREIVDRVDKILISLDGGGRKK